MKKMKKMLVLTLSLALTSSLFIACGKKDDTIKIGVSQYAPHDALDASYRGFVDGLSEAGYVDGDNIKINFQNASGDSGNATTIAQTLVNDESDLILAIATTAAQACVNATSEIPILVTAVTDPAGSGLVESNEAPGGNVSGTSDLTPVKKQLELLTRLLPDAKIVAILYTSSEVNSQIQAELAVKEATALGLETIEATVTSNNDIQQVVESLVGKVDAIYAPTDNTIANGMATVAMVANENGIPIIAGEEGMVSEGGLATYGISYYELGKQTAVQAVKILKGEATTDSMPIEYIDESKIALTINQEVAQQLGLVIPKEVLAELKK